MGKPGGNSRRYVVENGFRPEARTRGGLNALRGGGVTLLHKAGWTSKVRHDTGLLYSRRGALVVIVLTWNGRGVGSASDLLATRIARAASGRFLK